MLLAAACAPTEISSAAPETTSASVAAWSASRTRRSLTVVSSSDEVASLVAVPVIDRTASWSWASVPLSAVPMSPTSSREVTSTRRVRSPAVTSLSAATIWCSRLLIAWLIRSATAMPISRLTASSPTSKRVDWWPSVVTSCWRALPVCCCSSISRPSAATEAAPKGVVVLARQSAAASIFPAP